MSLLTTTKSCSISSSKFSFNLSDIITVIRDEDFSKTAYVPINTLLEPNNVIPSWEFGGEEKKEVSNTMRKLR